MSELTFETKTRDKARKHLLPHFTRGGAWHSPDLPVMVGGKGCYIVDDQGRWFFDGVSSLYCSNMGHGRADIADAGVRQLRSLGYWPTWSGAHPAAIDAASLVAEITPGDLDTVFFVNSGSEANESALKIVRQFHVANGQPERTKILARDMAYHGTTMGALSLTGVHGYKDTFAPMLMPGVLRFPNTLGESVPEGGSASDLPSIKRLREIIAREGGETIGALFAEPVQNSRGALAPPSGYWAELRSICDEHGILLVADEVICGFGRLGEWFGTTRYDVVPDLVTFAKGLTGGYAPMGGVAMRTDIAEALLTVSEANSGAFLHGATWGSHPVAAAIAAANIKAMRSDDVLANVRANEAFLREGADKLVGAHRSLREVRGAGYFYSFEITADSDDQAELSDEQSRALLREVMPAAGIAAGLVTRYDDRGATMLQIAPPAIAAQEDLATLLEQVDRVFTAVDTYLGL